jgi:hypothetical protein
MRTLKLTTMSLAALAVAGACSRGTDARPDDALKSDLALAAQVQPYQAQQFVSPTEQPLGANGTAPQYSATGRAPQPVRRAPAPVYRAPARRTSSRSAGQSSSGNGAGIYYPAPEPPRPVVKHTTRDAAIGAAAGAAVGAATGRSVKAGIIGAAAGGILGGIIGNNVDVQKP